MIYVTQFKNSFSIKIKIEITVMHFIAGFIEIKKYTSYIHIIHHMYLTIHSNLNSFKFS